MVITITTDFGDQFAASQLRAVIANLGFDGQAIENHSVTPFAILEGAFEIKEVARFSPESSVHLGVIDPGVGSERWGIVIKTKRSWLVGPNNGLLYPAAKEEGIEKVWKINEDFFGKNISNTFHGRDVFIKAVVFLAQGKLPEEFGYSVIDETLEQLNFQDGQVLHIDAYGNYKIYWPYKLEIGKYLSIQTKDDQIIKLPIVKTFDDVSPNTPLALFGSSNTLEIATNLSNAEKYFKFKLGDVLKIDLE